jgi:alkylation response protein AidB-like acyl-CoA dehydrogenase
MEVFKEAWEIGLINPTCPAEYGGAGLGTREAASLLVALTPARLKSDAAGTDVALLLGQTIWSEAGAAPTFTNASDRLAEFLRIDLK